jgi:hypothetical protein
MQRRGIFPCTAVAVRAEDLLPEVVPPSPFLFRDGDFDRELAGGFGHQSAGDQEPEKQNLDGDFGLPAQRALEEGGEVVSDDGQGQGGFVRDTVLGESPNCGKKKRSEPDQNFLTQRGTGPI